MGLCVARLSRPLLLPTSSNSPRHPPETLTRGGAQRPARPGRAERASAPGSAWAQPAVPALARVVRIASRKGGGESAAVPCGGKSPLLGGVSFAGDKHVSVFLRIGSSAVRGVHLHLGRRVGQDGARRRMGPCWFRFPCGLMGALANPASCQVPLTCGSL